MNKKIKFAALLIALTITSGAIAAVSAADRRLSSALDNIAAENPMIITGNITDGAHFSSEYFENSAGVCPASITITSLPPASEGRLLLASEEVRAGQTIAMTNFSLLRFIPNYEKTETSFRFTCDRSYTSECIIKIGNISNSAPCVSSALEFRTVADITCEGYLDGTDPDGDELYFEITEYPRHGLCEIIDTASGKYTYTPYEGYTGSDSFSYRVRDSLGSYSEESTVTLFTEERTDGMNFSDIESNPEYDAAAALISCGAMDAVFVDEDNIKFEPNEAITRENFVKTVMLALGSPELTSKSSGFADDADVDEECSGYIYEARRLGLIFGTPNTIGSSFNPKEPITCRDGANILCRITGISSSDGDAVSALSDAGIITRSMSTSPDEPLTRSQSAQLIYNIKSVYGA